MIVNVTNLKPGTAKSTSAVWLAHAWHEAGKSVLLVDADLGGAHSKIAPAAFDGLGTTGRWNERAAFPFDTITSPSRDLHKMLPKLAAGYDVTVIDSPPIEDQQGIAVSALRTCDLAVIPVAPTTPEIDRMAPMRAVLEELDALRADPLVSCVLLNRCVANTNSPGDTRDSLTRKGHHVLTAMIPRLELYAQSVGFPVTAKGTAYATAAAEILTYGQAHA
jgi:chromosome partitioning protein